MKNYTYVIIGAGMTAAAAVGGIREVDPNGSICLIGIEPYRPYNRPPLTKKLWQGKPEDMIWRKLPQNDLDIVLNCRVKAINLHSEQIEDEGGNFYRYKKLLLATGGTPRHLPAGTEDILYYRTLEDYHTLRSWTGKGKQIGVIGDGFIGSEISAALRMNGEQVIYAISGSAIGEHVYPADLAKNITDYYREKGVEIHPNSEVQAVERQGDRLVMQAKDGGKIEVDHIVAGIGIRPNTELAQASEIKIAGHEAGDGIIVDEHLRTNQPEIYAAGDVASFYNLALDRRMRVEHEDNANTMGRIAGLNMAGQPTRYDHQPYFYSDLFDLGYEAVGELDSRMDTYADWVEPFRKGVVYYLKDQRVRGVLLWNTWDQVEAARRLIAGGQEYTGDALKGRLPE